MYHPEYYSRDISSFNLEDGTKCVRGAINVLFLNSNYFLDPPTSTSILPKNGFLSFSGKLQIRRPFCCDSRRYLLFYLRQFANKGYLLIFYLPIFDF